MDIKPIQKNERSFSGMDYFFFWTGVAISLAEIWAGAFLAPLGLALGILAVILGHIIGNTILGFGGVIGSEYGLTSMVSVRPAFGVRGANLAAFLNIVQLIGWAAILLIIAAKAGAILGEPFGSFWGSYKTWTIIIGLFTLLWALCIGYSVWRFLQILACIIMIYVLILMTFVTFKHIDLNCFEITKNSQLHFMTAVDLVIAMPISFLPIVADYSRFSKGTKSAFLFTWFGFFMISAWMYILGLGGVIMLGIGEPTTLMSKTLVGFSIGIPALCMVIFSTVTSNFPDLYSATCSMRSMRIRINEKILMTFFAVLIIIIALIFPLNKYEDYLLVIGAMFIPLFGVVLTDYFILRKRILIVDELDKKKGQYWYFKGCNLTAFLAWILGFIVYEFIAINGYYIGGSIPALLVSGILYYILTISTVYAKKL